MVARVIVDISNGEVDKIFDYNVPDNVDVKAGDRLLVPFGARKIEGYCLETDAVYQGGRELKDIIKTMDDKPAVLPELIALMKYLKENAFIRQIDALRLFVPTKMRGGRVKELTRHAVSLAVGMTRERAAEIAGKRAPAQLRVIDYLAERGETLKSELAERFGAAAVKALSDKGIVTVSDKSVYRKPYGSLSHCANSVVLKDFQKECLKKILATDKTVTLLHGVTGSGKTEVYMSVIENVLRENKTAVMLVPEISLTPQTLSVFRGRFGECIAMLHSGLSDGERYDEWQRIRNGAARIVIGARSAVFAPAENIGVIIIDEEHDGSYISDSNPRYNTVDVAIFRGIYNKAKVILGSATPSIDNYRRAVSGEFNLVTMNSRVNDLVMPPMTVVDMGAEIKSGNVGILSREMEYELGAVLKNGNQAVIFINRRGFSSFIMCRECGYIAKCVDCDVTLTYHKEDNQLKCHYCGNRYMALTKCPECGSRSVKYGKAGTEQVVNELKRTFPGARILRMDNDTTNTKTAYLDILGAFRSREADILVGTQMISKGHDFPYVTLVGILDADISLYTADYRSAERTFQLVTQVAGRAGRSEREGKVVLQTFAPKNYVFKCAEKYDYERFYAREINTRETTNFPPFSTIVRVALSGADENGVIAAARKIYEGLKRVMAEHKSAIRFIQAMKSPITRIQGKHRYQIIMRLTRQDEKLILGLVHAETGKIKDRKVTVFVEVNPKNMN